MSRRLPIWTLIGPAALVLLYGFLIYVALTDQPGFYDAMTMPFPNHGFMHISWAGKTVAIWLTLLVSLTLRRHDFLLLSLLAVVTQQIGDTIAGASTGVDVVVTNIGLALSVLSFASLQLNAWLARRTQT